MAKEAGINQKLKFLYLADIFERETDEEHPLTVYDLSEKLEALGINAARKTLLDDIKLLEDYGMDIITVPVGKMLGYYLGSRSFELPEIKLLADAVSSSRFITEKKSRVLLKKLEGLTDKYHGQEINRRVYVSNRIKSENESIYISIDVIRQAIDSGRKISFRYFDRTLDMKKKYRQGGRTCSPYALAWNDGSYYLVASRKNTPPCPISASTEWRASPFLMKSPSLFPRALTPQNTPPPPFRCSAARNAPSPSALTTAL